MRCEENENVPVVRDVRCVGPKASLATERNATKTAEREGGTEVVVKHVGQISVIVVDFIRADGIRE